MFRTAIDIAGGVAAVVIAVCLGVVIAGADRPAQTNQASVAQHSVNREAKGDKLPVHETTQQRNKISVIEVIGVSETAVVYRDRGGHVLFNKDPVSNITFVSKNSPLPGITMRETEQDEVMPVPVEMTQKPAAVREIPNSVTVPPAKRIPEGCESAFSNFLVPSQSMIARRCVSSFGDTTKLSG